MIVKGLVSAIDEAANTIDVILPEYNNIVTRPTKVYGGTASGFVVNDFVLVQIFNNDFNDCIILGKYASSAVTARIIDDVLVVR